MKQEEKEVQAVMSLTNTMSIGIHYEDGSDDIWSKWLGGDIASRWCKAEIKYDEEGRAYFIKGGSTYYIDEFIRMNF